MFFYDSGVGIRYFGGVNVLLRRIKRRAGFSAVPIIIELDLQWARKQMGKYQMKGVSDHDDVGRN